MKKSRLTKGKKTRVSGFCVGDIVIMTDGKSSYTLDGTGRVFYGRDERKNAKVPKVFNFDEDQD